jgi:hypothetical protein
MESNLAASIVYILPWYWWIHMTLSVDPTVLITLVGIRGLISVLVWYITNPSIMEAGVLTAATTFLWLPTWFYVLDTMIYTLPISVLWPAIVFFFVDIVLVVQYWQVIWAAGVKK